MPQGRLTPKQVLVLQEALIAGYKKVDIRLRKGEYQYALAGAIASFLLELRFPNVKEITQKLYGEEKAESISFRRNIQTILKKMQKSDVVKILPKKKPWELQTYGLSSFKFEDVDRTHVILATEQEIEKVQDMLDSLSSKGITEAEGRHVDRNLLVLLLLVVASYTAVLWGLIQSTINPFIFIFAFSLAVVFSVMLGQTLSRR